MTRRILPLLFLLLSVMPLSASHIIGGSLTTRFIAGNNFEVTLRLFRDCSVALPIPYDDPSVVLIGLYDLVTDAQIGVFTPASLTVDTLDFGDACFTPNLCVNEGTYTMTINIPDNPNGYYLVWERCCRNAGIQNIVNPNQEGMTFYCEIPDPVLESSSPTFGPYPMDAYFCTNRPTNIDLLGGDIDGDSLVYSLVDPLGSPNTTPTMALLLNSAPGPYPPVTWQAPFSLADIVGGTPVMTIDPQTGQITASPTLLGNFVFAVKIEEYRNGVKLGEVRIELQYQSLFCGDNTPAEFDLSAWGPDTLIELEAGVDTCIIIGLTDNNVDDTLKLATISGTILDPNPDPPNLTFNSVSGIGGLLIGQLCWPTVCEDIRPDLYEFEFRAIEESCVADDTTFVKVKVRVVNGNVPPTVTLSPQIDRFTPGQTVCYDLTSTDANGDDLTIIGNSELFGEGRPYGPESNFSGLDGQFNQQFCWETACSDLRERAYSVNYKVTDDGCFPDTIDVDYSFSLAVNLDSIIDNLPNVFSPNGDNLNEIFELKTPINPCFNSFEINVFNRWGKPVFSSTDPTFQWKGESNGGGELANGVYFYTINALSEGQEWQRGGSVTLLR